MKIGERIAWTSFSQNLTACDFLAILAGMATLPANIAAKLNHQIKKTKSKLRIEDLVEEWASKMGGVAGVAEELAKEYKEARPGSLARAKNLDSFCKMLQFVSKKETTTAASDRSDEDLERAIKEQFDKYIQSVKIVEAPPNGPPPTTY